MKEFDAVLVADLVGQAYQAAFDSSEWTRFLSTIERIYPDSRVTLFGHNNGCPTADLAAYVNYPTDALEKYATYYARCSPFIARSDDIPTGRPFNYQSFVTDAELHKTEYYNDYVRPHQLGCNATGLIINRDHAPGTTPRRGTALSIAFHRSNEDWLKSQLHLLEILSPHLSRAIALHRTVVTERESAKATHAAFDHWAHASLVFDSSARLVTCNLAAQALLKQTDAVWLGRDGQLCTADEARTRAIETAIRQNGVVAGGAVNSAGQQRVTLPSPSGAEPLHAMIWPLPRESDPSGLKRGAVLMVIFDPARTQLTPIDWLAREYGLSASEQRLTAAIVNGTPLAEAAEQLGIRISTARTRLKNIQAKTHCHRQVDLVRLALSVPPIREP